MHRFQSYDSITHQAYSLIEYNQVYISLSQYSLFIFIINGINFILPCFLSGGLASDGPE